MSNWKDCLGKHTVFYYFIILSMILTIFPTGLPPYPEFNSPEENFYFQPAIILTLVFASTSAYLMGILGIRIVNDHEVSFFNGMRFHYSYLGTIACTAGQAICFQCFCSFIFSCTWSGGSAKWSVGKVIYWFCFIGVLCLGIFFTILIGFFVNSKRKYRKKYDQTRNLIKESEPLILEDISSENAKKLYLKCFNTNRLYIGFGIKKIELALYRHYLTKSYKDYLTTKRPLQTQSNISTALTTPPTLEQCCHICSTPYRPEDLLTLHPVCKHTAHWYCFTKYIVASVDCVHRGCEERYLSGMLGFIRGMMGEESEEEVRMWHERVCIEIYDM